MEFVEIERNGNWYAIELAYDGYTSVHKANGKQQLKELISDLIHDIESDAEFYGKIEWNKLAETLKGWEM